MKNNKERISRMKKICRKSIGGKKACRNISWVISRFRNDKGLRCYAIWASGKGKAIATDIVEHIQILDKYHDGKITQKEFIKRIIKEGHDEAKDK